MKSFSALLLFAVALAAVGGLLWLAGKSEERRASAEYSLITLRYERAATELEAAKGPPLLEPLLARLGSGNDNSVATAHYWSGDFEPVAATEDPDLQLLAANAEYRALRTTGAPWQVAVGKLDAIAKRYADILRTDPGNEDAAYNFEFVLRLRTLLTRARQNLPSTTPAATLTVHGFAGAPPQESDMKKFKMIVPMMPDERQEAEEAGRSGQKIRKG